MLKLEDGLTTLFLQDGQRSILTYKCFVPAVQAVFVISSVLGVGVYVASPTSSAKPLAVRMRIIRTANRKQESRITKWELQDTKSLV